MIRPALALAVLAPALAAAEDVRLTNGDVISGRVVERTEAAIVLEHAVLGTVTIPADGVIETGGELSTDPEVDDDAPDLSDAEQASVDRKEGLFGTPVLRGYDKTFTLGLTGTQGNSETLSFVTEFDALSEDDATRSELNLGYFYGAEEGERTRNELRAQARRDWKLAESDYFYFAQATYQYDDFEPWLHRFGPSAGVGYQFVDADDLQLLGRVGAGAVYEAGDVDQLTPEALIGVDLDWRVADGQTFRLRNVLYPSLDRFPENRNVTEASYRIDLDDVNDGLLVRFGVVNEYESRTEGDADHNDLKYFATVGLDF